MNKYKYSISIVCYNNLYLTKECIISVLKYSNDFELLLWNNGSTDGTKEYFDELKNDHKNIVVTHNETNIGFIIPQNSNAKLSKGEYFVCLNNDMVVCENWLNKLVKPFEDNSVAITGQQNTCTTISESLNGYQGNKLEYIEGSCLMIPKKLVNKYGLFDEVTFKFAYCEDVDLSLRLREKGYEIRTVPLNIIHKRASTAKIVNINIKEIQNHNHEILADKWSEYFKTHSFLRKILIKRKAAIGDNIMITPVIKRLKEKYETCEIDIWTDCGQVFENNPDVNKYFKEKPDIKKYDYYFNLDMVYEKEPLIHIIEAYSKVCKVKPLKELYLYPKETDNLKYKELYKGKKVVVFHTTHAPNWEGRNLPYNIYKYAAEYLRSLGYMVIEIGRSLNIKSDMAIPNTDFSELCAIIKHADLFIGQDSAPFHIAQSFKIHCIIPFGMILPEYRIIDESKVYVLQDKNSSCLGCHHYDIPKELPTKCKQDKVYCMLNLKEDNIKLLIDKYLDNKPKEISIIQQPIVNRIIITGNVKIKIGQGGR